jgi:hypothetical protein
MPNTLRGRLDRTLKHLIVETVAGAAAAVALFFFSLAAYISLGERYGAVVASLILGGAYLVLTLAALIWLRLMRRKEASQDAAVSAAQFLQDPLILSTGLEVLRALGSRKAAPLAVLVAGILVAVSRFGSRAKPAQSGSRAGA